MAADLIFGTSHTVAYVHGHQRLAAEGRVNHDLHRVTFNDKRFEPEVDFLPGGARANPAIIDELRTRIAALNPICLVTAAISSFHWTDGMALHEQPYDFWVPGLVNHPPMPDLELIPYDLMARHCHGGMSWLLAVVRELQRHIALPIFHIEAPPPIANVDLMVRHVRSHQPTWEKLQKAGLPSPSFRLKAWWAWTMAAREWCSTLGIHFVAAPPETRDAQGFLVERYYDDGVHGNVEYGALMVQEVAKAKQRVGLGYRAHA